MIRIPRTAVMILLAVGALVVTGCSSSKGGSAATGSADVSRPASGSGAAAKPGGIGTVPSSTPAQPTTAPATSPPTTTAPTTSPPATSAPTTSPPTTSAPTTTAPTISKTLAAAAFPLCPSVAATDIRGIVHCLRTSVSGFWSGELNQTVDQEVIVNPTASQVPAACRGGLSTSPAFTCKINDTVYINQSFLDEVRNDYGANDIPYALASVVSHEIGHVVQAAVKQPGYDKTGTSNTISQQIEQQADCLSGVWAISQAHLSGLDTKAFQTVAKQLISDVSSNPEIATHGTPDQRAAAIAQGLSTGTPQGCKLNTFA